MKNIQRLIGLSLVIALMYSGVTAFGQSTISPGKIKSKIIHEEKTVKGVKSTFIDSEEKFDQNGNVIEEIQYKDGKIDKRFLYEYDSNYNKVKETELDGSGKPKKTSEYKYLNGLRNEKLTYDDAKKLISKKTYSYIY